MARRSLVGRKRGFTECVWLSAFAHVCITECGQLLFGCCEPYYARASSVFGCLHVDFDLGSHDSQSTLAQPHQI